jgi:hypothetical protein
MGGGEGSGGELGMIWARETWAHMGKRGVRGLRGGRGVVTNLE